MSNRSASRRSRSMWPGLAEWFAGLPSRAKLRPMVPSQVMRLEDEMTDGPYQVWAEIPGIDPSKDVDITVCDGQLTIQAERSEKKESTERSESSYRPLVRTVSLPAGADEDHITATYDTRILTVSVPAAEPEPAEKRIEVTAG